jgi:hypothetical protein
MAIIKKTNNKNAGENGIAFLITSSFVSHYVGYRSVRFHPE